MFALLRAVALLAGLSPPPAVEPLRRGTPIERSISAGDVHVYELQVRRGEFVRVEVAQQGVQTLLTLEGPGLEPTIARRAPTGPYGVNRVSGIAAGTGAWDLLICVLGKGSGSYRVRVESERVAGASDRLRVAAERSTQSMSWNVGATEPERQAAIQREREALGLWKRTHDPRGQAEELTHIGFAEFRSGQAPEALASHTAALALWSRLGDREGQAETLNGIGMAHSYMAAYARAVEHYRRAVEIERRLGDKAGEARVLSNMGIALAALGEADQARDCYERALPLRKATGDRRGEAYTLGSLADLDRDYGDGRRALELQTQVAEIAAKVGDRFLEGMALSEIGSLNTRLLNYTAAIDFLQKARPVLRETGNRRVEARTISALGVVHARQGDDAGAIALYEEALAMHREAGDRHGEAQTLGQIGASCMALGEYGKAREAYDWGLEIERAVGSPGGTAGALTRLARLEQREGRREDARVHLNEALRLVERRREKMARPADRAAALSRWQAAYRLSAELYLEEHAANPGAGFDGLAFREAERARSRALLESLFEAHLDLAGQLPEELRLKEETLASSLSELQKKWAGAREPTPSVEEDLRQAEEEWERLLTEIRKQSPRYASLQYPEPASVEAVRARLGPHTALVSFVIGETRSFAFVVSGSGLRVVDLPDARPKTSEEIENYVGLLSSGGVSEFEKMAGRLAAILLDPWLKSLPVGVDRLVLVPDEALGFLPFEALPDPASGRAILERFVVSYAASATVFVELAKAERSQPWQDSAVALAVFASPRTPAAFSSDIATVDGEPVNLPPLEAAAEEGRVVARYGGKGTHLWTGPDASERRVKSESLDRFRVLHFATHALLSRTVPSRSALVLSAARDEKDDGLLQAREIYRLRLRSDLVVLSGCQTARGKILSGEGMQSLAQAFVHAGARTVVASLWNVNDRRTAELMEAFYRGLAEGEPKADALRLAKLELLRREPGLAPKYWAAFILLGEPAERVPLKLPGRGF